MRASFVIDPSSARPAFLLFRTMGHRSLDDASHPAHTNSAELLKSSGFSLSAASPPGDARPPRPSSLPLAIVGRPGGAEACAQKKMTCLRGDEKVEFVHLRGGRTHGKVTRESSFSETRQSLWQTSARNTITNTSWNPHATANTPTTHLQMSEPSTSGIQLSSPCEAIFLSR